MTDSNPLAQEWKEREKALIRRLDSTIERYSFRAEKARLRHRRIGIILLVCSVLAPIAVAGGGGNISLVPPGVAQVLALALTIIVALSDGLRRMFRFDRQWHACARTRNAMRAAKIQYEDEKVGLEVGSVEWLKIYTILKIEAKRLKDEETDEFFNVVNAEMDQSKVSAR